jgi:hypothetical protein
VILPAGSLNRFGRLATRRLGSAGCAAVIGLLAATSAVVASESPPHWDFQLAIQAPESPGEPFVVQVGLTLLGSRVGNVVPSVSTTYSVLAVAPDGTKHPLTEGATEQANIVGWMRHVDFHYQPMQNGEWAFQIWQLDGTREVLLIEQRVPTDKASQPAIRGDAQFVSAIRTDPVQPIVGQSVTILVDLTNQAPGALREIPINLIDDEGVHPLGSVANPGPGNTASLVWVPQQSIADGLLEALGFTVLVVAQDAAAPLTQDGVEPDTTDPSSD